MQEALQCGGCETDITREKYTRTVREGLEINWCVICSSDELMLENIDPTMTTASLPAPVNLTRQAKRKRRANRPVEPVDLTFEINEEHIPPNFF